MLAAAWRAHRPTRSALAPSNDQEECDMYDMGKLKNMTNLDAGAADAMKAFWEFDKAVFKEGEISVLNKQLIAVAVALTTQCVYCIEIHTQQAREAGATDAQLAEATTVAAAIRAGGAITHGAHLFAGEPVKTQARPARPDGPAYTPVSIAHVSKATRPGE
jgi:AhpD family alkylhydroperoxidase